MKNKKVNWADKCLITIMLILLASLLSQFTLGDLSVQANQLSLREFCTGAPECYPIDENGNTITELEFGEELKSAITPSEWKLPEAIWFTSYNPEVGQTDASPCTGAGLTDVCQLTRDGVRPIALSQDLVGRAPWKPYTYGDVVTMVSDEPACNGTFQIEDTMNERYSRRGDIFQLDRSTNVSCWATIVKGELRQHLNFYL